MHFSKSLKTAALAGLFGLGFLVAATSPAMADRSYTRCDRDGDRCWHVVCDWDGDDCHSIPIRSSYYDSYRGYRNNDRQVDRGYYDSGYRRWVCDRYSRDCHWSYGRRW